MSVRFSSGNSDWTNNLPHPESWSWSVHGVEQGDIGVLAHPALLPLAPEVFGWETQSYCVLLSRHPPARGEPWIGAHG